MKTRLARIVTAVLPAAFALSVILAATALAEGNKPAHPVNVTAMGQSLHAQLRGQAFEFAIETDGRLDLTGEGRGVATPAGAVELVRSDRFGGTDATCHIRLGDTEVALVIVNGDDHPALPCGVVGEAYDAAI